MATRVRREERLLNLLGALLSAWGEPGPTDIDDSGATDSADLGTLLSAWTG